MSGTMTILRAGPMVSVQDAGRPGLLAHGIAASGPMDKSGFALANGLAGGGGEIGIECGALGVDFLYSGPKRRMGFAGGQFTIRRNGKEATWPGRIILEDGDRVEITAGPVGNYGYLIFDGSVDVSPVLGSRATNITMELGGHKGRALAKGDVIPLGPVSSDQGIGVQSPEVRDEPDTGPIGIVWGIHADLFSGKVRSRFIEAAFSISPQIDRMGIRLLDRKQVFSEQTILSLVSDAVVPGDIQILGDGTPVVLMRDHQPTGGYPRIATVISAHLDRLAQMRPGSPVRFAPVQVGTAHDLMKRRGRL